MRMWNIHNVGKALYIGIEIIQKLQKPPFHPSKRETQKDSQHKYNNSHQKCFAKPRRSYCIECKRYCQSKTFIWKPCYDSKKCLYLQNEESYIRKNLLYETYLSDINLWKYFFHLFSLYAEQPEKPPSSESTQSNKHFNFKASKRIKELHLFWIEEHLL